MTTKHMTMRPDPVFVARALRWAGIEANVTPDPDGGDGVTCTDVNTGKEVTIDALFSAVLLAFVDAGSPTHTIMDGPR